MMGNEGRRSVTPPLVHRPFLTLLADRAVAPVGPEPDRSHVEAPRRRKVVPSWQQSPREPEQLELPVVTVELADVEAAVEVAVEAAVEQVSENEEREVVVPRSKKPIDAAGRRDILKRAAAAVAARKAGKPGETYADIGKDYGINAQAVANLVSRLRLRQARKAEAAAAATAPTPASSPPAAKAAPKGQGLFLRFDRPVQVEIVGLEEYIDGKVKAAMARFDELLETKAKAVIALALRKGIG